MSVEFLWRIPVHGDGRRAHQLHTRGEWNQLTPAVQSPQRVAPQHEDQLFAYYDYVEQVAKAADIVGFHGALIPAFPHTEEPWVLASALARETKDFVCSSQFSLGLFILLMQAKWLQVCSA